MRLPVATAAPVERTLILAERPDDILQAVVTLSAAVLGHDDPAEIEPGRRFLELGFDSLASLELRRRLAVATGLDLPASLTFDHPTPALLAKHLGAALTAPAPRSDGGILGQLYRRAAETDRLDDFMTLVSDASEFRPVFTDPAEVTPDLVRLSSGPGTPVIVGCSGMTAAGGPHEFARFAAGLRGIRQVDAVALPGFAAGEDLPATGEVALRAQARTILDAVGATLFVLVGHSAGAIMAHALARHMEEAGVGLAGLVLVDVYLPFSEVLTGWQAELAGGVLAETTVPLDDHRPDRQHRLRPPVHGVETGTARRAGVAGARVGTARHARGRLAGDLAPRPHGRRRPRRPLHHDGRPRGRRRRGRAELAGRRHPYREGAVHDERRPVDPAVPSRPQGPGPAGLPPARGRLGELLHARLLDHVAQGGRAGRAVPGPPGPPQRAPHPRPDDPRRPDRRGAVLLGRPPDGPVRPLDGRRPGLRGRRCAWRPPAPPPPASSSPAAARPRRSGPRTSTSAATTAWSRS